MDGNKHNKYVYIRVPPDVANRIKCRRLKFTLYDEKNLLEVLKKLALYSDSYFSELIEGSGSTKEGPFIFVFNNKIIRFQDLDKIAVSPDDELVLIAPILGG